MSAAGSQHAGAGHGPQSAARGALAEDVEGQIVYRRGGTCGAGVNMEMWIPPGNLT